MKYILAILLVALGLTGCDVTTNIAILTSRTVVGSEDTEQPMTGGGRVEATVPIK